MTKEYIIREDVINDIGELFTLCRETLPNECWHHFIVENELQTHLDFVRNLPAADVVEVKHGRWNRIDHDVLNCNKCGSTFIVLQGYDKMRHCPNCGAKMDGGQDDA